MTENFHQNPLCAADTILGKSEDFCPQKFSKSDSALENFEGQNFWKILMHKNAIKKDRGHTGDFDENFPS